MDKKEIIQSPGRPNCYFMATMIALVDHGFNLDSMIYDNKTVKFCVPWALDFLWKKRVSIQQEHLETAWETIEAAWNRFSGNPAGGSSIRVFYAFTGKWPKTFYMDTLSGLLELDKYPMTIDSSLNPGIAGIVPIHSYSIQSISYAGLYLENPWRRYEPGNDGSDDGIFFLTWEQIKTSFLFVNVLKKNWL